MLQPYQTPSVTTLGSLADLTLTFKATGNKSDGDAYNGSSLYTVSCDCYSS